MDAAMMNVLDASSKATPGASMDTIALAAAAAASEHQQQQPIPMDTTEDDTVVSAIVALTEKQKAHDANSKASAQKIQKSRKKKARRNKDPDIKIYKEPSDTDVLLGRGGRSNHHIGNIAYRDEVGNLREWYRSSEKNAKTDLSQLLVDWVQKERQGQFMKMEESTGKWYIVTNIVARRKASQALREHMTRDERELKKKQDLEAAAAKKKKKKQQNR
jgi:hypothetical protein